ncbi:MAG: PepSY domain-containing protein [Polaromonas sp.]|uniref:PepSY domain-containing protein n=1 Tax=Polaromonas sp. TaxID=1869339 RepID=UPI0027361A8A|nr:PepSY domain-containing protein [Polaromonas sp.]MDP2817225.1 PepSY domain-containing protein [Polaromonas sp.]
MTFILPFVLVGKRRRPLRGALWVLALLIGSLGLQPAWSGGRDDHNRARQALQAGEVLPLGKVLELLEREHPGQVMEVELEQEEGRWVYEVKLLQPQGQLVKLKLDARTAALLSTRGGSTSDARSGRDTRP